LHISDKQCSSDFSIRNLFSKNKDRDLSKKFKQTPVRNFDSATIYGIKFSTIGSVTTLTLVQR